MGPGEAQEIEPHPPQLDNGSINGKIHGKSMGNPWEIHGESMEIHGKDGYKWRFIAVNFIV